MSCLPKGQPEQELAGTSRRKCPFYGFSGATGARGIKLFRDSHGNQCPIKSGATRHSPCVMEMQGEVPDWNICCYNCPRTQQALENIKATNALLGIVLRDELARRFPNVATSQQQPPAATSDATVLLRTKLRVSPNPSADSELLVKQMRGEYRVKNAGLKPLFLDACSLVRKIGDVTFTHVRREQNKEADRLSNLGMDEAERTSPGK